MKSFQILIRPRLQTIQGSQQFFCYLLVDSCEGVVEKSLPLTILHYFFFPSRSLGVILGVRTSGTLLNQGIEGCVLGHVFCRFQGGKQMRVRNGIRERTMNYHKMGIQVINI